MKVDVDKLKAKIGEKFSNEEFAEEIGIDVSTLYRKLQKDGDTFLVREVASIIKVLNLSKDEFEDIFFASRLAEMREEDGGQEDTQNG